MKKILFNVIIATLVLTGSSLFANQGNVLFAHIDSESEQLVEINQNPNIAEGKEVLIISEHGFKINRSGKDKDKDNTLCTNKKLSDEDVLCRSIFGTSTSAKAIASNSTMGVIGNSLLAVVSLGIVPAAQGLTYYVYEDIDKLNEFIKSNNLDIVYPNFIAEKKFKQKYSLVADSIKKIELAYNDVGFTQKLNEQRAELDKKLAAIAAEKERLAKIEKERLAKIAAEKERLAKIERERWNTLAQKECKSDYLKKKKQTLNECIENFKRETLVKKEHDDKLKKEEERMIAEAKLLEKKEYFELSGKIIKRTVKDEFGNTVIVKQCAIIEEYRKRRNSSDSEIIKIYSQVFEKDFVSNINAPSQWWLRTSHIKGAVPVLINRGIIPSSIEVNSMNFQDKEKNVKTNASIYSILGYVNKYLNDYSDINTKTTRSRMMLFYSFLIANGVVDVPASKGGLSSECELNIDMFVDPGVSFIKLLADKDISSVKLLGVLVEANHSKTTKYLLSDSRTKKIFEEMKSYKW